MTPFAQVLQHNDDSRAPFSSYNLPTRTSEQKSKTIFTVSVVDRAGRSPGFGHNRDIGSFAIEIGEHCVAAASPRMGSATAPMDVQEQFWLSTAEDARLIAFALVDVLDRWVAVHRAHWSLDARPDLGSARQELLDIAKAEGIQILNVSAVVAMLGN